MAARPTKAIIAVAGFGTRWLPVTKALEKCMIPVGARPVVDYAVDSCIKAGITDIIFVVGEQSSQIRTFYGHNQQLEDYLVDHDKVDVLMNISGLEVKARFHYVVQTNKDPRGTTTPLWIARNYIMPGESFVFMYGDNLHYHPDGRSVVSHLLEAAEEASASCAMLANEEPEEKLHRYGIVGLEPRDGREYYSHIVEKPKPGEAPSNLNNSGCFLFPSEIFPFAERSIGQIDETHNEHLLIDAINWYREANNEVLVVRSNAEWLDCGSVPDWVAANNRVVNG